MRLHAAVFATLIAAGLPALAADVAPATAAAPAASADPLAKVPLAWRVSPEGTPLDAAAIRQLEKGEVLSALIEVKDNPVKKGVAIGLIPAAPAKVLGTCTDFEHFPDFMPYVGKINVDKREGNDATVSYWLEFPLGIGNRNYQLQLHADTKTIDGLKIYLSDWKYTGKGNIVDTSGSWEIAPYGDGTRSFVRYTVLTDPGGSLPTWAKNKGASVALPKVVKRVQERVTKPEAAKPVEY